MSRVTFAIFLAIWICSACSAQPSAPQYLEVREFRGIDQSLPAHLSDLGTAGAGKNFDVDACGALVRSITSTQRATPTGFGTLSNCTAFGDCDPNKTDTDRILFLCIDCTSPTDGLEGQHILAASLEDDGDTNGIVIGSSISWQQVDSSDELALSSSKFDGFYVLAKGRDLAYLSTTQGILEIAGEQGSASCSDPVTCAWVGTPARPTVAENGAGNLSGTYQYRVTFVSDLGESLPSKPSALGTVSSKKNTVTFTVGPDACLSRRVYRTKGALGLISNDGFETWASGSFTGWSGTTGATVTTGVISLDDFETLSTWNHTGNSVTAQSSSGPHEGTYSTLHHFGGPVPTSGTSAKTHSPAIDTSLYEIIYLWLHIDNMDSLAAYSIEGHDFVSELTTGWQKLDLTSYIDASMSAYNITVSQGSYGAERWYKHDDLHAVHGLYEGVYSAYVVRATTDCALHQPFDGTALRGQSAVLTAYVRCGTASTARIGIYDDGGTDWAYSAYHTGGGTWEQLTATNSIHAAASTSCQVGMWVANNDEGASFDKVILGGGGGYYHLTSIADNTATTYSDDTADASLGAAETTTSRYYVPAAPWICHHGDRLWSIGKTQATTQRQLLWYTDDSDLEHWPADNYIIVGDEGEPATGLASHRGVLYVLKRKSIWGLRGYDDSDFSLKRIVSGVGCEDGRTVQVSDDGIYFYGSSTIWMFDGGMLRNIGQPIEQGYLEDVYIDSDEVTYQANALFAKDRYRLGYKQTGGGDYARYVLDFNRRTVQWSRTQLVGYPSAWHYPATLSDSILAVGDDGDIWEIEDEGHDDASSQKLEFITHALDFGDRLVKKRLDRIILAVDSTWATTGTAYQIDLYKDVTEQQVRDTGLPAAHATKTFELADGLNTLEWCLAGESVTNVVETAVIKISESGEADDTGELDEKPPRLLGLIIQYRKFRRRP